MGAGRLDGRARGALVRRGHAPTWAARAALHVAGVRHGREVCTARHPRCDTCVLSDLCPSAAILGPTSGRA
ncbi:hypothetical protein [Deinococcus aquaticus]|uniref:hypothetical protein n=1 Tax=Deinococcus aquaticus TaxID=328692 RepID=UPI003617F260